MMAGCDNDCGGAIPVSENSSLHGALNYAARGWFVFPGLAFGLMFLGVAVGKKKQGGLKKNATFFKNAFEKLAGR